MFWISPSSLTEFRLCSQKWAWRKVVGVQPLLTSVALHMGTALHDAFRAIVEAAWWDLEVDPAEVFAQSYLNLEKKEPVDYSSGQFKTQKKVLRAGRAMARHLAKAWPTLGLTPVEWREGPAVEVPGRKVIGPGLGVHGFMDIVVTDRQGRFGVIDLKSARNFSIGMYAPEWSDQGTAYTLLAEDVFARRVDFFGYLDVKKALYTGRVKPPFVQDNIGPRPSDVAIRQFLARCRWMKEDIERERIARNTAMAFNSPCKMCDFHDLCLHGRWDSVRKALPKAA